MSIKSDRQLLVNALRKRLHPRTFAEGDVEHQILTIGRWGTCSGCPRDIPYKRPDLCQFTDRYDHHIDEALGGGEFMFDGQPATREWLESYVTSAA